MTEFGLEYGLKLTVLFCIPIALAAAGRFVSADARSRATVSVFTMALLLPIALLTVPEFSLSPVAIEATKPLAHFPGFHGAFGPSTLAGSVADASADFSPWLASALYVGFVVVTVFLLARVAFGVFRALNIGRPLPPICDPHIEQLARSVATQLGLERQVELKFQNLTGTPFVCGVFPPIVALPFDFVEWPEAKQRAALSHEFAHIYRGDHTKYVFVQFAASILWWHPLALYAAYRYRGDIEQACDDMVVSQGTQHATYAKYLLEVARQQNSTTQKLAIHMAAGNALRRRVSALMNPGQRRSHMSNTQKRMLTLTAAVVLYGVGAAQISAAQPDDRRYMPIFKVVPEYPPAAEAQRIEGFVLVEFDVDAQGKPVNIHTVDQSPADGIFEASAVAATERFRYLPERQAGSDVTKQGVRNRLTFSLADENDSANTQIDSVDELARSSKQARKQLTEQLHEDIANAEKSTNADQFVRLAKVALEIDPAVAEYLIVRASQIGTPNTNELRMVGGRVLHRRGAHRDAIELFRSVTDGTAEQTELASRWVTYLEREIARTAVVHSTLVGLAR